MWGDNHKFACVLISPNFQALESWAKGQGVATGDHAALVKDPKVVAEYGRIVESVNKTLGHHETLKRVTVVPDDVGNRDGRTDAEHEAEAESGGEEIREGDWRVL